MVPSLVAAIDWPVFATEIRINGDEIEQLVKKSLLTIWSVAPEFSKNSILLTLIRWIRSVLSIMNAKPSASAMFVCTDFKFCTRLSYRCIRL